MSTTAGSAIILSVNATGGVGYQWQRLPAGTTTWINVQDGDTYFDGIINPEFLPVGGVTAADLDTGLFGEGTLPRSFRLVDTQLNTTGAVLHVYERAGGLKYGEVEVGQETVIFD